MVRLGHSLSVLERKDLLYAVLFVNDVRALSAPFGKPQLFGQATDLLKADAARIVTELLDEFPQPGLCQGLFHFRHQNG